MYVIYSLRECHYLKRTKKTSKIENLHCSLGLLPQTMMVSSAGHPVFQYCAKLKLTKIVGQQSIYSLRGGKGDADAPIASPSLRAWVREHRFRTPSFELTDIGWPAKKTLSVPWDSIWPPCGESLLLLPDTPDFLCHLFLASGNYTVLTVTFPFKRRMGYYIIQVYIPCVFLVMLSWIVFWMRPDDSASRLTVGITTILTIVFLLGYTNGMLPKVRLPTTKNQDGMNHSVYRSPGNIAPR